MQEPSWTVRMNNHNCVLNSVFQIFQGNTDASSVVRHDLVPAIIARYIRVHPGYELGNNVCMRLELYDCSFQEGL